MTHCRNLWLFLVAGMQILRGPMGTSAAENPCPDVFYYEGGPGSEYGTIVVPNPYPYLAIEITVEIYITAPVPPNSPTKLEPVDRDMWNKLYEGSRDPVLYRLDFPVSSPLPTIKSITVNQNVICRGSRPSNTGYLSTVTVQHKIFNDRCNSASLECPYNIQQSLGTRTQPPPQLPPPQSQPQYIDSSSSTSPCPDVFRYERDGSGDWYGIISVPNPYPVVAIDISVQLYVAAFTSTVRGRLDLINGLNREWERMRTGEQYFIQYRLDFPVQSPLPTVKSITVNNQRICQGSKPNSPPVTTASFQHSLFNKECTSASLDCPDNTIQTGQTIRPPQRPPPQRPPPQRPPPQRPPTQRPTQPPAQSPTKEPSIPKPQTPPPARPEPPEGTKTGCEFPVRPNPLILLGHNTTPGQWPWHVALFHHQGYNTIYMCGGSFVGTKTIITAAHCVTTRNGERMPAKDFSVHLGRYDLTNHREQNAQQIDVHSIFVHEEYNSSFLENDVAMLVLNSSVQITAEVRPVCLWNPGDTSLRNIKGKNGVVVGWGLDEFGMTADKLKVVMMPVVSQDICVKSDIKFFSIFTHETTFCAGFRNGSSVCNGDSGGGMVFLERQRDGSEIWKLRGLVSNSKADDDKNTICNAKNYVIFTDIAHYIGWISRHLS